jgi:hypothetical protein
MCAVAFSPNALTCSDLAWRISPSAFMALDVHQQRRLGVPIEKEQCLNAGSSSGQHARRCRACPKCIPHVEAANHAFETSNKCGALLEVILLTRSSSSPHFVSAVSPLSLLTPDSGDISHQIVSFPIRLECRYKLSCACIFTVLVPRNSLSNYA